MPSSAVARGGWGWLGLVALLAAASPRSSGATRLRQWKLLALEADPGGLLVGTAPGSSNVVSGFEVTENWKSGNDLAAKVGMAEPSTMFYLKADVGLVLTRVLVEPALGTHARLHLRGAVADRLGDRGSFAMGPGETVSVEVEYECLTPGAFQPSLTLEFDGLSPVTISWDKTCGGEDNKALTITGGTDNDKVVVQGIPRWDESKVVGTSASRTQFAIAVDPLSEQQTQEISTPRAIATGACSVQMRTAVNPKTTIDSSTTVAAEVRYACQQHGTCIVTMEVPFFPDMAPFRPVRWAWTKMCGGSALGIDVEADADGVKHEMVRDGAPNVSSDLVLNGELLHHKVWLTNDEGRSNEPEVRVTMLNVDCLDSLHCSASLKGPVPKLLNSSSAAPLDVAYTCWTSGSSLVRLVLETEGHDPITVMWTKDCAVWTDSLGGIMLFSFVVCTCLACGVIGCCTVCCKDPDYIYGYGDSSEDPTKPPPQGAAGQEVDGETDTEDEGPS